MKKYSLIFLLIIIPMLVFVQLYKITPSLSSNLQNLELRYNAADDFSDIGSDFWNYYYYNNDDSKKMNKLQIHSGGLFDNYYFDGSLGKEYQYVVGTADYISNSYHQYLCVWGGIMLHPGGTADVVISFVAPVDGVINISATIKGMDPNSDGVLIYATKNDMVTSIYSDGKEYILHRGTNNFDYKIENLSVNRGDEIFFRVNKNQDLSFDATYFSPTISYLEYQLPDDIALELSSKEITVEKGGIRLLDAWVNINLGQRLNYSFTSLDTNVVEVKENGLIYAINEGTTEIVVLEEESGLSSRCTVTVTKENEKKNNQSGCKGSIQVTSIIYLLVIILIVEGIKRIRLNKIR